MASTPRVAPNGGAQPIDIPDDETRFERIVSGLEADDQAWLRRRIEPPWRTRLRRLDERDAAIRELGSHFLHLRRGRAIAEACATDLSRYRASGWQHEQGKPAVGDTTRVLLHRILTLNGGKTIGRDRIREILAGVAGKNRSKAATAPATQAGPITHRDDDAPPPGEEGYRPGRRG
jgi:hypothetical protein